MVIVMDNNIEHDHENMHVHEHENGNIHEHEHIHAYDIIGEESKDEKTLQILLTHWVDHNKSHEETFLEWARKSKTLGKEKTSQCIEKAIEYMKMADNMLIEARKHM